MLYICKKFKTMTFNEIISALGLKKRINSSAFLKSIDDKEIARVGHVKRLAEACEDLQNNPVDIRPYKVYTALLTQSGTGDFTVIELENTLGEVTFEYVSTGNYNISSTGLFIDNKTFFIIPASNYASDGIIFTIDWSSTSLISLTSFDTSTELGIGSALNKTPIEIRVYN